MLNLVSRNPKGIINVVGAETYKAYFGLLTSPRNRKNIPAAIEAGVKWAADNDCYGYWKRGEPYDTKPLLRFLEQSRQYAGHCLFINAPDVLTDARGTLENFWYWRDIIQAYGYPVAFTVQNGIEHYPPPWGYFDALFVGSSNPVKYSHHVAGLVAEARRRGLWVHNGRVNGKGVVRYSKEIGCNSFDGTGFTHDPLKTLDVLFYQQNSIPTLIPLEEVI